MIVQRTRAISPAARKVSAADDVEAVGRFTRLLEDAEAARSGVPVSEARVAVARRIGASPGFFERGRRGRLKIVPNWLMTRIRAAVVAELNRQIAGLENEIAIAGGSDVADPDDALGAAQAQVARAREALTRATAGGA